MNKIWIERQFDRNLESIYLKKHKQDPLFARLLSQRNIPVDQFEQFFDARFDVMKKAKLTGVDKAAEIIMTAARNQERVGIIGDYDVDGVVSSIMLSVIFETLYLNAKVFLPSRLLHGYGLNEKTVMDFIKDNKNEMPAVLVVTDCGTSSEIHIKKLKEAGVKKIIVIDHHIPDTKNLSVSADVLINWRISGDQEMCAAGEVMMLAFYLEDNHGVALSRNLLPLSAIGTVADVSPVIGLNRSLVRNGLLKAGFIGLPGVKALLDKVKCLSVNGEITQSNVQFQVAPRINAPGRVAHPIIAFNALNCNEYNDAIYLIEGMEAYNVDRKKICRETADQAIAQAQKLLPFSGIVVYQPEWHIGVVGIVASRLVETFNCPALVFGNHNGKIKGSGRSIKGINVKDILDHCSDLFEVYGGHEMAVGATLKPEALDKIQKVFSDLCSKTMSKNDLSFTHYYDAELKSESITMELATKIKNSFYPYCATHNPEPIFKVSNVMIDKVFIRQPPGMDWRLLLLSASKGNYNIPIQFKTFDEDIQTDIKDKVVDLYFTLPQTLDGQYESCLELVDVVQK